MISIEREKFFLNQYFIDNLLPIILDVNYIYVIYYRPYGMEAKNCKK